MIQPPPRRSMVTTSVFGTTSPLASFTGAVSVTFFVPPSPFGCSGLTAVIVKTVTIPSSCGSKMTVDSA